jgi:serine/threonine protein kinase
MDPAIYAAAAKSLGVTNLAALGTGGQKMVAVADGPNGQTIVKIVELVPPYAAIALERARREVGVLASITHPNVVKLGSGLVEVGTPPIAVCWLEEYLDGQDLEARRGPLHPWPDVAGMASDVAAGLTAFHDAGAVHRDLSPRNVRCLANGSYKLMDPGIARLLAETTITGPVDPGSCGYMSPEHVSPAARPTFASDVFGLGILMYEQLTGQCPIPFLGDRADYARRLQTEQPASVAVRRPDLSPAQAQFVDTCLQRQLARRYLDAREAYDALVAL